MSKNNSSRGRTGISGSASVEVERIDTGSTAPLVSDSDELLLAKIVGEDGSGDFRRIAVDSAGELQVQGLKNHGGITAGEDTGGGQLPSNPIPRGRTVRVQAKPGNGATVSIEGNFQLQPGQAVDLGGNNTDKISYTAAAGDGVEFIVEA